MDDIEIQPDIQEQVVQNIPDMFRMQKEGDKKPSVNDKPERSGVDVLSEAAQQSGVNGETAQNRPSITDRLFSLVGKETGSSNSAERFSGTPDDHHDDHSKDTPQGLVDVFPEQPPGTAKENPHITGSTGQSNIEYLGDDLKQMLGQARSQMSKEEGNETKKSFSDNQPHDIKDIGRGQAQNGGNDNNHNNKQDAAETTDQAPGLMESMKKGFQGFQGLRDKMEDVGHPDMSSNERPPTHSTIDDEPKASQASTLPFVGKTVKQDEKPSPSLGDEVKNAANESGQQIEDDLQQRKASIQHMAEESKEGIKSLLQVDKDDNNPLEQQKQPGWDPLTPSTSSPAPPSSQ
mmetsp:Transcript_21793/g.37520  ORF Transcript_21793/g.37520 Transcript_21793/m.37520 type:complete len:347 (-) Transcript_21793:177-1217(-)